MPELPDVAVFKGYMDATALHQKISESEVRDDYLLKEVSRRTLRSRLRDRSLESTRRHGKNLFAELSDAAGWLLLHFGMTGFLKYFKDPDDEPPHTRLLLRFRNGYHLAYDCQRKLGEIRLIEDPDAYIEDHDLGPDALSLDLERFRDILDGRRGSVKSALMNQRAMAGVGNVYSDEALYQARIHPGRAVADLRDAEIGRLHRKLGYVLESAIERRARPDRFPRTWLVVHREPGATCPRCGGTIERAEFSGRGAYLCPGCQPEKG